MEGYYSIAYTPNGWIMHHGVLGMKWGVRRYRNYDGTYTQRGLKRYDKAAAEYDKANQAYKSAKKSKNSLDIAVAKGKRKEAKKNLSDAYDDVKLFNKGDKGKLLYAKGKTMTANKEAMNKIASGTSIAAIATYKVLSNSSRVVVSKYGPKPVKDIAPYAAAGVAALGATAIGVKAFENSRMKAYWFGIRGNKKAKVEG